MPKQNQKKVQAKGTAVKSEASVAKKAEKSKKPEVEEKPVAVEVKAKTVPKTVKKTEKKTEKKGDHKSEKKGEKGEKKTEPEEIKKTFITAVVKDVMNGANFRYIKAGEKDDRQNEMIATISGIMCPCFMKREKKEEKFTFECTQHLRNLIIGKTLKLQVDYVPENGMSKRVTPFLGNVNIAEQMLNDGYAVGSRDRHCIELGKAAEAAKKGMFSGVAAIERPKKQFVDGGFYKEHDGKTIKCVVGPIHCPAVFAFTLPDRKMFEVRLMGVNQLLDHDNTKRNAYVLDEDGEAAMKYIEETYHQRDATVTMKKSEKTSFAVVMIEGKDVAEELLRRGFVVLPRNLDMLTEDQKMRYTAAEKEAKKNHLARWTDFDQAKEDELLAARQKQQDDLKARQENAETITGEVCSISDCYLKVKSGKDVTEVHCASVEKIFHRDDLAFNDAVKFKFAELARKFLVGKKVICKKCYEDSFVVKDKHIVRAMYDVYVNKKNFAVELLKAGIFHTTFERDPFRQSFDIAELRQVERVNFVPEPIQEIGELEKEQMKDVFMNNSFSAVVEKVLTVSRLVIYIPEKKCRILVNVTGSKVPRSDDESVKAFVKQSNQQVRELIGLGEVQVEFKDYVKGTYYVDVFIGKQSLHDYVIKNNLAMATGRDLDDDVIAARDAKKGIYALADKFPQRQGTFKTDDAEKKPAREARPFAERGERGEHGDRKPREHGITFSKADNVFIVGFDGSKVYYYKNEQEAKYVDAMEAKLKAVKRGAVKEVDNASCIVESQKKLYRAKIIKAVPSANIIKCIDTGVVLTAGKNKLRPTTDEIEKMEVKVNSIALAGIECLVRGKDEEFDQMVEKVQSFCNKTAQVELAKEEQPVAKITVDKVCINVALVADGLATLEKFFKDSTAWGVEMSKAQNNAKAEHVNVWKYGELQDPDEDEKPEGFKGHHDEVKKDLKKGDKKAAAKGEKKPAKAAEEKPAEK